MKLDELKAQANAYLDGLASAEEFQSAIMAFLDTASPEDYEAFALWIVEQGKGKEH
jgi:hypothetical protein